MEIITCSATHAYIPFIFETEAIYAQVKTAVEVYKEHFGCYPKGIWLLGNVLIIKYLEQVTILNMRGCSLDKPICREK